MYNASKTDDNHPQNYRKVGPIPRDAGMRNRLYSTVMNTERSERERKALGADIVGVILADVQITRVFCDAKDAL